MDYKSVFENTQLSTATKKSYINKMKKMMIIYNNEIPSFARINNDNNITVNNKYGYINCILAYKKHKGLARDENEQRIYKDIYEKLKTFSNEPSIKQKENDAAKHSTPKPPVPTNPKSFQPASLPPKKHAAQPRAHAPSPKSPTRRPQPHAAPALAQAQRSDA